MADVVEMWERLPRGSNGTLGTASRMMWDVLFDLEPASKDEMIREYEKRIADVPGLNGSMLRRYASKLRSKGLYHGNQEHDRVRAVRSYVVQWLAHRKRAHQVARREDGRYTHTAKYGRIRDSHTDEMVSYTPQRSRDWRAGITLAQQQQAQRLTITGLTEDLNPEQIGELIYMAAREAFRNRRRSGTTTVWDSRLSGGVVRSIAVRSASLRHRLGNDPALDLETLRMLIDQYEAKCEAQEE